MSKQNLNDRFDIRVSPEDKLAFFSKCEDLGRAPQSLVREMMSAVVNGNLRIHVTEEQMKSQQEIYYVY